MITHRTIFPRLDFDNLSIHVTCSAMLNFSRTKWKDDVMSSNNGMSSALHAVILSPGALSSNPHLLRIKSVTHNRIRHHIASVMMIRIYNRCSMLSKKFPTSSRTKDPERCSETYCGKTALLHHKTFFFTRPVFIFVLGESDSSLSGTCCN